MKPVLTLTVALLALAAFADPARASLIILGNLPPINDAGGATVDAGTDPSTGGIHIRQAISFTMPAQSYPVVQVNLHLGQYNTAAGDVAAVGFYLDTGNDLPGSLVGSLLKNPASNSDDISAFIFIPQAPLTLAASTKYWLQLDSIAGMYAWRSSGPPVTPTSQVGASYGKQIGFIADDPRDVNITISNFQIAASIPEPCSLVLAAAALLNAFVLSKARQNEVR